jgi:HSP20 family protein
MAETRSGQHRTDIAQWQRNPERPSEQNRSPTARRLMRRLQDDFDRLFGSFPYGQSLGDREVLDWIPPIEAFQRGSDFVIRVDVPGLSRDDLSVDVGDDAVTICGDHKQEHQDEREGVFRSERHYGSFCRTVALPEGAVGESAKANLKDGVLEIVVQAPSQEAGRGRRIEIQ